MLDTLELQKSIEEKRLILGEKIEKFLLKELLKFSVFFARILAAKSTAIFGSIFIIAVSILAQSLRDIGHDSATYLEIVKKMVVGGKYFDDFFESNLPLNYVVTMIPFFLAKFFNFNLIATAEIFWNLLGIFSIYFSSKILKRSDLLKDQTIFNLVILSFTAGFFWRVFTLQFNEFGTKTTYLLTLLFPYISYHFLSEEKLKNFDQILSGVLAGLLFCFKPHYGIFPIIFELTKIVKSRRFFSVFCLRNYTTLTVLLIYLLILFRFFPDYIDKLPLLSSTYYKTAHNLTFLMFVQDIFPILLISALCFDFVKKEPVFFVLFLSVIAAALLILTELIGGLDQRFVLYSISLPLVVLLIFFLNKNQQINWQRDWILLLAILFLPQFDAKNIFALASYLACFWWVFALFLFRKWRIGNLLKFTLVALAIVTIALMIVGGFTKIPWAISLIIFILILYLDQKSYEKKELSRLSACVIFLVLSYFLSLNIAAIFNLKNNYDSYKFSSPNHFNSEVIKVIKHYSHKDESFVAIAEGIPGIYPSITYAGRKNALPFLQYGFLFKQIGNEKESENPSLKYMMNRLKQQMEAPNNKLVFVENQHYAQKDRCVIGFLENYFRDAEFREIFLKNYVFLTLITNETGDHEFEVYIRQ